MSWVGEEERAFVDRIVREVGGWLTNAEGEFLYALSARGPENGAIVEIGSNRGKSTILLARAAKLAERERIHSVDPHRGNTEREFRENLAKEGLTDRVTTHIVSSHDLIETWTEPIRLLFIDGDHTYEGARADYVDWGRHVVPGGVIVLHDTFKWDGPRQVVEEFILKARDVTLIGIVDSITAVRRLVHAATYRAPRHVGLRMTRSFYLKFRRSRMPGEVRKLSKKLLLVLSSPPEA